MFLCFIALIHPRRSRYPGLFRRAGEAVHLLSCCGDGRSQYKHYKPQDMSRTYQHMTYWLIVWNIWIIFHRLGIIIPTRLTCFKGVETTNQYHMICPSNSSFHEKMDGSVKYIVGIAVGAIQNHQAN